MKYFFKEFGWAVLILIAIIVAGLLFVYLPKKMGEKPDFSSSTSTPVVIAGDDLTSQTISQYDPTQNSRVTVVYPHVTGIATSTAIKINANIDAQINGIISDFKSNLADEHSTASKKKGYGTSSLDISFVEEKHSTLQNTISFSLNGSTYYDGSAHPVSVVQTFNYDTRSGDSLSLRDLFGPFNAAIQVISDDSTRVLKSGLSNGDPDVDAQIMDGAGPDESNFAAFLLADKGLIIKFDQCQVASCSAGVQQVMIPYTELLSYALPGTVLDSVRDAQ